ncbi:MAG: hypothetical protein C0582_01265 [Alphaproteobacteria bacterium]|nr:MAG: hypothetical protein C0582_01265 [Alphaproteobacteria bacterium]
MAFQKKNNTPIFILKQAFMSLVQNHKQIFYMTALPLFFIGLSRLLQVAFPALSNPVFSFFTLLDYIFQVVFAVEWIRFLSTRRRHKTILIPQPNRRYFTYGVLSLGLFFMNSLLMSVLSSVLGMLAGGGVYGLLGLAIVMKISYLFLFARLSPAFVGAANDKPENIPFAWPKTQAYWSKLLGYLLLVQLIVILLNMIVVSLMILPQLSAQKLEILRKNPLDLIKMMRAGFWFLQVFAYIGLALEVYGIWFFNKKKI